MTFLYPRDLLISYLFTRVAAVNVYVICPAYGQPLLISALRLILWSFLRMVAVEEIMGDNEPNEVFNSRKERTTVYQCEKIPSIDP